MHYWTQIIAIVMMFTVISKRSSVGVLVKAFPLTTSASGAAHSAMSYFRTKIRPVHGYRGSFDDSFILKNSPTFKQFRKLSNVSATAAAAAVASINLPGADMTTLEFANRIGIAVADDDTICIDEIVSEYAQAGKLTRTMIAVALSGLRRLHNLKINSQEQLLSHWGDYVAFNLRDVISAAGIIQSFAKLRMMPEAEKIAKGVGIDTDPLELRVNIESDEVTHDARDKIGCILSSMALGYFNSNKTSKALHTLELMEQHSLFPDKIMSKEIVRKVVSDTDVETIRHALRLLSSGGGQMHGADTLQLLTNSFVRSADFVTGAVSMETLPDIPEECREVAFIGRSNVGKSSLVNMLTNQKRLAYVSDKPGKTSEFNYFNIKGVVGAKKEQHQFYLVDLPGVGYARKAKQMRSLWSDLFQDYAYNRASLRAIFHLVDSRHGLLKADYECLRLLKHLPDQVRYVLVFTKDDKLKGAHDNDMNQELQRIMLIEGFYKEISQYTSRVIPVVFTSSKSCSGGCTVWSHILDSVAYSSSSSSSFSFSAEENVSGEEEK